MRKDEDKRKKNKMERIRNIKLTTRSRVKEKRAEMHRAIFGNGEGRKRKKSKRKGFGPFDPVDQAIDQAQANCYVHPLQAQFPKPNPYWAPKNPKPK
jgi:hypothetical protein